MQIYEKSYGLGKKILLDFIDFLKFKVENGELTADEIESIVRAVVKESDVYATAEELAAFYGQPVQNVRCVISRKLIKRPRRKVYYPLREFQDVVPESWHKNNITQ